MENNIRQAKEAIFPAQAITPEALLNHWQGHRRLTRRVIEAFPEKAFFSYSIGGMRPFAAMVMEMIGTAGPGIQGAVTGEWPSFTNLPVPETRLEVLQLWDEVTRQINTQWPQIPPHRFEQQEAAFGMFKGTICSHIFYFIDNEIHHRGQGYVYLRSLGIEPPPFYERD